MARMVERLSAIEVRSAAEPGMLADGKGLYLRIGPTGAKSWIFRYRHDGRRHDLGLGPFPDISLADARERAYRQRRLRLDGQDPLAVRRTGRDQARLEAAKAMTFRQCAEKYIAAHQAGWRNAKHGAQWGSTLGTYVYPTFGDLPVQAVDVGLVMKAVEPMWAAKPETASRVRGRIESILDWARARGYRDGKNPARWKGHLDQILAAPSKAKRAVRVARSKGEHHAVLPYAEVGAFVSSLRAQNGMAARALEFAILTAARTGEVIGAKWAEIDFKGAVWTIPGGRMKAGKKHRVPLSAPALAILEALPRGEASDRVFPLSNMALLMTLRRMGRGDLTTHGFRSTFRDWSAERTSFPAEVAEMALAHAVGDKVEAAYRRDDLFDKRRQLAEAWADFCAGVEPAENIVALRAARA